MSDFYEAFEHIAQRTDESLLDKIADAADLINEE